MTDSERRFEAILQRARDRNERSRKLQFMVGSSITDAEIEEAWNSLPETFRSEWGHLGKAMFVGMAKMYGLKRRARDGR